jgi:hypothetical protein
MTVRLIAGIGSTRQFILLKRKGRIYVNYILTVSSAGDTHTSLTEFALNDLYSLIETLFGSQVSAMFDNAKILPSVQKQLDSD